MIRNDQPFKTRTPLICTTKDTMIASDQRFPQQTNKKSRNSRRIRTSAKNELAVPSLAGKRLHPGLALFERLSSNTIHSIQNELLRFLERKLLIWSFHSRLDLVTADSKIHLMFRSVGSVRPRYSLGAPGDTDRADTSKPGCKTFESDMNAVPSLKERPLPRNI